MKTMETTSNENNKHNVEMKTFNGDDIKIKTIQTGNKNNRNDTNPCTKRINPIYVNYVN